MQGFYPVALGGLALTFSLALWVTYTHWKEVLKLPKIVLILAGTLVILAASIPTTSFERMYALGMGCTLIAASILGSAILTPLGIGAIIGSIGGVLLSFLSSPLSTSSFLLARGGGIYSPSNYNTAAGVILLGVVLWRWKYQWLAIPIAILGALATGADEAFVVIAVVGFVVLIRRDWSLKILPTVAVLLIPLILLLAAPSYIQNLWQVSQATLRTITNSNNIEGTTYSSNGNLYYTSQQTLANIAKYDLAFRWLPITNSFKDIKPFGHGYAPYDWLYTTVHNVPLRVLYELGPLGLLAWLGLIIWGLKRTTWIYAFTAVIAASLFDHYMWTQLSPYFFTLLGVASIKREDSDRIFSREDDRR